MKISSRHSSLTIEQINQALVPLGQLELSKTQTKRIEGIYLQLSFSAQEAYKADPCHFYPVPLVLANLEVIRPDLAPLDIRKATKLLEGFIVNPDHPDRPLIAAGIHARRVAGPRVQFLGLREVDRAIRFPPSSLEAMMEIWETLPVHNRRPIAFSPKKILEASKGKIGSSIQLTRAMNIAISAGLVEKQGNLYRRGQKQLVVVYPDNYYIAGQVYDLEVGIDTPPVIQQGMLEQPSTEESDFLDEFDRQLHKAKIYADALKQRDSLEAVIADSTIKANDFRQLLKQEQEKIDRAEEMLGSLNDPEYRESYEVVLDMKQNLLAG